MKKEAQKKLLKVISETADNMIKGKTCWWGKEAVETAIIKWLEDEVISIDTKVLEQDILPDYLPEPTRPGEGK